MEALSFAAILSEIAGLLSAVGASQSPTGKAALAVLSGMLSKNNVGDWNRRN